MPVAYTNILILGVFAVLGTAAAFLIADAAYLSGRLLKLCGGPLSFLKARLSALTGKSAPAAEAVNAKAEEAPDADSPDAGSEAIVSAPSGRPDAERGGADESELISPPASRPADGGEEPKAALICLGASGFFILTASFMLSLPLILSFWNESVNKGAKLSIGHIGMTAAVFAAVSCSAPLFFKKASPSKGKAD